MAVVSLKNPWVNGDGLPVYFPADTAVSTRGGEVDFDGRHMQVYVVDLTALPTVASGNVQIVNESVRIPSGVFIEQMDILVRKETTGTNANLDIGLVKVDRSTEIDFNGLLTAGDDFNGGTDLGAKYSYVLGTTDAGAILGKKTSFEGYLTVNAETADWTAGIIEIRLYWSVPLSADV